jgi:hypothetical protein
VAPSLRCAASAVMKSWTRTPAAIIAFTAMVCLHSRPAAAHSVVTPYDLPIPFSVYVYACAGTLILTFAVLLFIPPQADVLTARPWHIWRLPKLAVMAVRICALFLLGFAVIVGFVGTPSPIANPAMFLTWTLLMLGLTSLTILIGDLFALANPWLSLARLFRIGDQPILAYPDQLGHWPAFVCYLGLAWLELMAPPIPALLAWVLLSYTVCTLFAAALFGRGIWFEQAELFGLFFRLVGAMAPLVWERQSETWQVRRRAALSGVLRPRSQGGQSASARLSLVVFVLFMLAATTYDGAWQTSFWAGLYWGNLMHWLQPLWGNDFARAQALLAPGYVVYQRGGLFAAPFVYLAVYLLVIAAMRIMMPHRMPLLDLAVRFAPSLVPIAVAYMLAHNWTAILSSIPVVPFLVADPFGLGWNLIGLPALLTAEPPPLDMGQVWHVEVALILVGHVSSVYAAHLVVAQMVSGRRVMWASEAILLGLMVVYTFIGLVVLSLPLALH